VLKLAREYGPGGPPGSKPERLVRPLDGPGPSRMPQSVGLALAAVVLVGWRLRRRGR
jgi:hypothetical protein